MSERAGMDPRFWSYDRVLMQFPEDHPSKISIIKRVLSLVSVVGLAYLLASNKDGFGSVVNNFLSRAFNAQSTIIAKMHEENPPKPLPQISKDMEYAKTVRTGLEDHGFPIDTYLSFGQKRTFEAEYPGVGILKLKYPIKATPEVLQNNGNEIIGNINAGDTFDGYATMIIRRSLGVPAIVWTAGKDPVTEKPTFAALGDIDCGKYHSYTKGGLDEIVRNAIASYMYRHPNECSYVAPVAKVADLGK